MCGRFTLLADEMKIRERFLIDHPIANFHMSYNIAPTQNVLAVIHDGKKRRAGYLRWGLIPAWAKDERIGNNMINARSETAHEKPSFKRLMARKRCLIIADSFYEWMTTDSGKVPKRIQVTDHELFAFAGLWDKWQRGEQTLFTCTILTKEADESFKNVHHRMPIILPKEQEEQWITPVFKTALEAQQFITNVATQEVTTYTVSNYVNNAKNNDERCIARITD